MNGRKQKTILIVDDDDDILNAMTMILEAGGFQVRSASCGEGCLKEVERAFPDLILMDVMMERATEGLSVGYRIRSDPGSASIPIILMSSIETESTLSLSKDQKGFGSIADDYLTKPIAPSVLLERVSRLLESGSHGETK